MALQDGLLNPTLATRTQIGTTVTAEGVYQLYVDVSELTDTEYAVIEIEVQTSNGGSFRQAAKYTFGSDNSDLLIYSVPIQSPWGWRAYLTQENGTARDFQWWIASL